MEYKSRDEVENIYKWDLAKLYPDDEAWEKDYKKLKKEIKIISKYAEQDILATAEILFETLECYFQTNTKLHRLYLYVNAKSDEDVANAKAGANVDQAYSLYSEFIQNASFINPTILKAKKSVINKLIKNKKLNKYRFYLEDLIRSKDHMLSENEEIIVAKLTESLDTFEKINSILTNSTLEYGYVNIDGNEVQITNSNFRSLMMSPNCEVRKKTYQLFTNKLKEYENVFASALIASAKTHQHLAQIRNHQAVLDMDLFESNIPKTIYHNLFEVVQSRLSVYQKYFQMLKSHLGLEKLSYCDIDAEIVPTETNFTIEEARFILEKSLSILGEEYLGIIRKSFDERWIDFANYKGKMSGAYATACYGVTPLVLTNYRGKLSDVSILAHELGHVANYQMSIQHTNEHEFSTDFFTAEVASLTNEVLLSHFIISNSGDKNLKLTAIYNLLYTIQHNLFDACIEGKLEHQMYEVLDNGGTISVDFLNETIYNIRNEYYGDAVVIDENSKILWAKRAHYFIPYYLYKYATGICAAIYVAKKIINNEDNMKESFLEFLSKGSTNYPHELLKEMGVDLENPSVINEAIDYMDYLIDEFNKVSEEE